MSLYHIFGETPEIKVFDLLGENLGMEYSVKEIVEKTGLSEDVVKGVLIKFIFNNMIVKGTEKFSLDLNPVTTKILEAILITSSIALDNDEEEISKRIAKEVF